MHQKIAVNVWSTYRLQVESVLLHPHHYKCHLRLVRIPTFILYSISSRTQKFANLLNLLPAIRLLSVFAFVLGRYTDHMELPQTHLGEQCENEQHQHDE